MSWLITGTQKTILGLPQEQILGQPLEGGFFAGYISHTQNGVPTHALIVAPRATGASGTGYTLTTNLQIKTTATATADTNSIFDGVANTAAMVTAGITDHPAAQFCVSLNIGGFTDWYLPALFELEIAYFNLKPSTTNNVTFAGANAYAVPRRNANYTVSAPAQTAITAFNTSTEAFVADNHWSSSEPAPGPANTWTVIFNNGTQLDVIKTNTNRRVRAFRRIAL
jgi:hypothetical protein